MILWETMETSSVLASDTETRLKCHIKKFKKHGSVLICTYIQKIKAIGKLWLAEYVLNT